MPNSNLVSVIVPVYNVKSYLQECFDSICRQSYQNIEIILVDDGSTDGSGELCDVLAANDDRTAVLHKKTAVFPTLVMQGCALLRAIGLALSTVMTMFLLSSLKSS